MITWNQTWHPTCRTWLWQMELCLNSSILPVLIKQNSQNLKANGRTKTVRFVEVDQKSWEQRAVENSCMEIKRKKLVTRVENQKDWEMYFWTTGISYYQRELKHFKTSMVKVQMYLDCFVGKDGISKILFNSEQKFYWKWHLFLVKFEVTFWCPSAQLHWSHIMSCQLCSVRISKPAASLITLGVPLSLLC